MHCNSAALRRIPACFIAPFRFGPGGIVRACSRAVRASAASSSLGRRFLFGRASSQNTSVDSGLSVGCWTLEPKREQDSYRSWNIIAPHLAADGKPSLSAGVIGGAQRKEYPMIRHLAVIGTLAAFAAAPAMAQQPTAPGQVMHKSGSLSKGASAYAPGHLKKHKLAIRGRPGASGYAPGHAAETKINTKSGMTTGASVNTRSGMTTGSSANTRSDVTTGSTAPSRPQR